MSGVFELCPVTALVRCERSGHNLRFEGLMHSNDTDDLFFLKEHHDFGTKIEKSKTDTN